MHVKTFEVINSATLIYLRELERLRAALVNQLSQVEAQIMICRDFADDTVEMPLPLDEPAKEPQQREDKPVEAKEVKPFEPLKNKPLFLENWQKEAASPSGVIPVNVEGRPILSDDDLKRLEAAVAEV